MFYHFFKGSFNIYDGPDAFLPSTLIHTFDLTLGAVLGVILIVNAGRMWRLTMNQNVKFSVPWWLYVKSILLLPLHFFTQKRYSECEHNDTSKFYMPWLIHLGLMWGYVTMLILVMVFLPYLQSGPAIFWEAHIFGYIATIGLLAGVFYFIYKRAGKKAYVQYKKSHSTDWVFIILLMLITLSGIAQHLFHRTGLTVAANITYLLHLMFVVPWLVRMPFTKWSHLMYRPLAMYFADVRRSAYALQPGSQITYNPALQII